ncbi:hypothetical protein QTP88_008692 [Uroleucon formosanum]
MCILTECYKIRCPINRQIGILHTDPSASPLHLAMWHTRSIGNVFGRRSKADVFGFFVLRFPLFTCDAIHFVHD